MLSGSAGKGKTSFPDLRFNPFQGIQVLSVQVNAQTLSNLKFQSLSGNSSVVGTSFVISSVEQVTFQSLSGNSSVVGRLNFISLPIWFQVSIPFREFKCCRSSCVTAIDPVNAVGFNPFQGIQVLSANKPHTVRCQAYSQFQSLSGNSSVVGQKPNRHAICGFFSFNPFQGIQVLSANPFALPLERPEKFQSLSGNSSVVGLYVVHVTVISEKFVSIPFREFKCCRIKSPTTKVSIPWPVSIPFREFKCCRREYVADSPEFGTSVSIPFREFKCCRWYASTPVRLCWLVSIPFREFKCCRSGKHPGRREMHAEFQSLSGNSSVVGWFAGCPASGSQSQFQSLSGNSSVVGSSLAITLYHCTSVSIPFREFKCCRRVWRTGLQISSPVSIPFREFKCCRFEVVCSKGDGTKVSIPFREFKCCRTAPMLSVCRPFGSFNPFQGIQVLSALPSPLLYLLNFSAFQSLSGNSSVVGWRLQSNPPH